MASSRLAALRPPAQLLDASSSRPAYPLTARSSQGVSPAPAHASRRQHDEVVAVDDFVREAVGEVGGAAARDASSERPTCSGTGPWRTPRPCSSTISTGGVGVEVAFDAAHARRQQRLAAARPARARAPASTTIGPRRPARTRSRACGSSRRCARGANDGADRSARERVGDDIVGATPPRSPRARPTTPRSWRPRACSPCRRCPASVPAPPATRSSAASTSTISSISDASSSLPRVGGEDARRCR